MLAFFNTSQRKNILSGRHAEQGSCKRKKPIIIRTVKAQVQWLTVDDQQSQSTTTHTQCPDMNIPNCWIPTYMSNHQLQLLQSMNPSSHHSFSSILFEYFYLRFYVYIPNSIIFGPANFYYPWKWEKDFFFLNYTYNTYNECNISPIPSPHVSKI